MRWQGGTEPNLPPLKGLEWLRFGGRMIGFGFITLVLIPIYALLRLIEFGVGGRKISRLAIWAWARTGCWACGLRVETVGTPMQHGGARVMNHVGWIDVFTLLTASSQFFVAKSEVRSWPFMGWLAAYTGTMFVERNRQAAKRQEAELLARVQTGDRLGFFPEGTSTDGRQVAPFKSTLFAAFMSPAVIDEMWIQPVSVYYRPAKGVRSTFYCWWGEMPFLAHFMSVVGRSRGGVARVVFHPAVRAADFADRKVLAAHCEAEVIKGHAAERALADG